MIDFKTWGSFRLDVFIRDNGICKMCGKVIAEKDERGYWPSQPDLFVTTLSLFVLMERIGGKILK